MAVLPWPQLIMLAASFAISYINRPKTSTVEALAFEEFEFPVAEAGTAQYVIFGDVWIEDWIVLSYGNFRTTKIQTEGGKTAILGWVPGLAPGTTNPIEAALDMSSWDPVSQQLYEWDPTQPEELDPDGISSTASGDTWIPK
jgi:hypothetical protein